MSCSSFWQSISGKASPSTASNEPEQLNHPFVNEFKLSVSEEVQLDQSFPSSESIHLEKENSMGQRHVTDRFIPIRKTCSEMSILLDRKLSSEDHGNKSEAKRGQEVREKKITVEQMFQTQVLKSSRGNKLLTFSHGDRKSENNENHKNNKQRQFKQRQNLLNTQLSRVSKPSAPVRTISKLPYKVLDAPNLLDDFYLNLLQWSPTNILSVALDTSIYFWNANNNRVMRFCDLPQNTVTSLDWNAAGSQLAVGTSLGTVEIWDASRGSKVQTLLGHTARVSSLAWSSSGYIATGSRDRTINVRDFRVGNSSQIINTYEAHTQQICGLKWSQDGNSLASGGNDNKLLVWNLRASKVPVNKFTQHTAAVKGIAWSPHNHGVLVSGGGSVDRTMKFWNTKEDTLMDSIDTGSQVCNITFSKNTKEIVTTHGFANNQIVIWKYPSLQKTATLMGHSSRVLYLALSPNGENIVTGAGDETLRFWSVFPADTSPYSGPSHNSLSSMELR